MSYFKKLTLDTLKIDKAFVYEVETDLADQAIVKSYVNLARGLGMSIITEDVETQSQASKLKAMGCDSYQGYFFNKPMRLNEFYQLVVEKEIPYTTV